MNRKTTFCHIALITCLAGTALAQEKDKKKAAQLSPEQRAIQKNAEAFVNAFNKGDAKAVAALWTAGGHMSVNGEVIAEGRDAIEKAYAEFFKENEGVQISVTIDSIRLLGPNLAIEKGASQITSGDEAPRVVDAYTLVHVKQGKEWLTATADVVEQQVVPEFDWKEELSFLEGKWTTKAKGWSVETSVEWVANDNFLRRKFTVENEEEGKRSGIQIIGWDPAVGAVTSWVFGADGGHGRGWWTQDGDNWVIESEGTTADGEIIRATNVITLLGKDAFRWQSTDRSIDAVAIDNTDSILVTRVKNNTK